jgi:chromosome segregation ATPase
VWVYGGDMTKEEIEKEADILFEKECGGTERMERVKLKLWHRYGYEAGHASRQDKFDLLCETLAERDGEIERLKKERGQIQEHANKLGDLLQDATMKRMELEGELEKVQDSHESCIRTCDNLRNIMSEEKKILIKEIEDHTATKERVKELEESANTYLNHPDIDTFNNLRKVLQ